MMLWDDTYSCLLGTPSFRAADLNVAEDIVQKQEECNDLTDNEREMSKGWFLLRNYVKGQPLGSGDTHTKSMQELLSAIVAFAKLSVENICSKDYSAGQLPDSVLLQEAYLVLDYLRACSKISHFHHHYYQLPKYNGSIKHGVSTKDQLNGKMKEIETQLGKLRGSISTWHTAVSKRSVSSLAEQLLSGPFSNHLSDLVGPDLLRSYAKTFLESAMDALDGLLKAAKI